METIEYYANFLDRTWPGSEPKIWAAHLADTMEKYQCSVRGAYDILHRQLLEDRANPDFF
jgi:hypothetical protein